MVEVKRKSYLAILQEMMDKEPSRRKIGRFEKIEYSTLDHGINSGIGKKISEITSVKEKIEC